MGNKFDLIINIVKVVFTMILIVFVIYSLLRGNRPDRFAFGPFEFPLSTTESPTNELVNLWAEPDGIVWNTEFYYHHDGECNPISPSIFNGTIQGARNGLRAEWQTNSPGQGIPRDYFVGVFSTDHNFNAGSYCFELIEPDDGVVLYVDGKEIVDACYGFTAGAVYRNIVPLEQGPHTIRLNYFENFENASFHLAWNPLFSECKSVVNP